MEPKDSRPAEPALDSWGLLRITASRTGDQLIVILEGELDVYSASDLETRLRRLEPDTALIRLDLRRLDFIDCAGLRAIAGARRRAGDRGASLELIRGPGRVHRVFELAGLYGDFRFVDPGDPGQPRPGGMITPQELE